MEFIYKGRRIFDRLGNEMLDKIIKVDLGLMQDYVDRGLLRKAEDEDLIQFNYTEMVNSSPNGELWDDITLFNRGNIYEKKTGYLVARSMPKFMNFFQYDEKTQQNFLSRPFTVTEKLDGCLGIIYKYKGKIRCNSRGSFDNYVTDKMKELLPKYVLLNHLLEHQNLVVEVISPVTKVICDYGDEEDLHLITAYSTHSREEILRITCELLSACSYMPIVKQVQMSWEELFTWQKNTGYDKEGFVLTFDNGDGTYDRVKIKSDEYLRMAYYKCKLCKHRIWRLYKNDLEQNTEFLKEYFNELPDELYSIAKQYFSEITADIEQKRLEAVKLYEDTLDIPRDTLYSKIHDNELWPCVFLLRDGKQLDKSLIKFVEPVESSIII